MDFKYEECKPDATRSGRLYQLKVADLHPTQSAVGLDEVNAKAESMCQKNRDELIAFLITRPVPVVIGNDDKFYVTDHYHLARAVWDMVHKKNAAVVDGGSVRVVVEVVAN